MIERDKAIALVEGSPSAVTAKDKQRWLSLFAPNAYVEDPVGSRPNVHDGDLEKGALARFYETFIAGNEIIFHREHDYVCGNKVMRDLVLEIRMTDKVINHVPMHLLYEIDDSGVEKGGELKISRLAAHWELAPMLAGQMKFGLAVIPAGIKSMVAMLKNIGISGMMGFMQARRNVGDAGKQVLQDFESAINQHDMALIKNHWANGAQVMWGDLPVKAEQWKAAKGHITLGKTLSAGVYSSASFEWDLETGPIKGVMMAEFNSVTDLHIKHLAFYV